MPNSLHVLNLITAAKDLRPVAVFDLDSTLYNVSHRTQYIMQQFANEPEIRRLFPEEAAQLLNIKVEPYDWGMRESLMRANFKAPEEFIKKIKNYWGQHFFSSRYLHKDMPYEGAVEYVNTLAQKGAEIYYLTGRDAKNMLQGTIESLAAHGFPNHDLENRLIMKPFKGSSEDEDFKAQKIHELKTKLNELGLHESAVHHPHMWFFENEPVIIHKVRAAHPEIQIVWLDTTHSRKAEPPKDILFMQSFKLR